MMSTIHILQQKNRIFQCLSHLRSTMQRHATVLTFASVLLCISFNYTFPLHREPSDLYHTNSTQQCNVLGHRENILERTKHMASNIENALKRIKDSTQDFGKNIYEHVNLKSSDKNLLSEKDIRQYEQLVIMKKYPYLDLKELELKYSPSNKNARQSIKFDSDTNNFGNDPSICEPLEDGPNVEITNRGLSGFAIPQLSRHGMEGKTKFNILNSNGDKSDNLIKIAKKSPQSTVLGNLRDDVRKYVESKKII